MEDQLNLTSKPSHSPIKSKKPIEVVFFNLSAWTWFGVFSLF